MNNIDHSNRVISDSCSKASLRASISEVNEKSGAGLTEDEVDTQAKKLYDEVLFMAKRAGSCRFRESMDNLISEIGLKATEKWARYNKNNGPIYAFLFTAANNAERSKWKKENKNHRFVSLEEQNEDGEYYCPYENQISDLSCDDLVLKHQSEAMIRHMIRKVFDRMNSECSELEQRIFRYRIDGLKNREIAAILGCSSKVVENAYGRARVKLLPIKERLLSEMEADTGCSTLLELFDTAHQGIDGVAYKAMSSNDLKKAA